MLKGVFPYTCILLLLFVFVAHGKKPNFRDNLYKSTEFVPAKEKEPVLPPIPDQHGNTKHRYRTPDFDSAKEDYLIQCSGCRALVPDLVGALAKERKRLRRPLGELEAMELLADRCAKAPEEYTLEYLGDTDYRFVRSEDSQSVTGGATDYIKGICREIVENHEEVIVEAGGKTSEEVDLRESICGSKGLKYCSVLKKLVEKESRKDL